MCTRTHSVRDCRFSTLARHSNNACRVSPGRGNRYLSATVCVHGVRSIRGGRESARLKTSYDILRADFVPDPMRTHSTGTEPSM